MMKKKKSRAIREREGEREGERDRWWKGTDSGVFAGRPKAAPVLSAYSQTSVFCNMKHR